MGREIHETYILSRAYSERSARQRRSILGRFTATFDPVDGDAEAFLDWWATTEHLAPATRRAMLQAVDGFLSWLIDAGHRSNNPARLVRAPKVPRKPPKVLTATQCRELRAHVSGTDLELPVELMLGLGLRLSEAAGVQPSDLVGGVLSVTGKGGKTAMLPATPDVQRLWHQAPWPLSTQTLYRRTVAAMQAVGIVGHSPHSLRRTCGTEMARRVPLHVVAAILRHESVSTTTGHYTAVSMDDMRRAIA
jgi:integrase